MPTGLVCNKAKMTSIVVVMLCYWALAPHLLTWLKPAIDKTWIKSERQCLQEEQCFSFSGCMTVRTRSSQICISIDLTMEDIVGDECDGHITSLVAASLLDG